MHTPRLGLFMTLLAVLVGLGLWLARAQESAPPAMAPPPPGSENPADPPAPPDAVTDEGVPPPAAQPAPPDTEPAGAPAPAAEPGAPLDPADAVRAAAAAADDPRTAPPPGETTATSRMNASDDASGFLAVDEEAGVGALETVQDEPADNLISITLDDVEVVDVVRMFTRISGANIIATPSNLQGRVTVNLANVEWKPALESILDMHGLALMEKLPGSKVYSVVPRQPGAPEPMQVQTYFLKYATVSTVEPVVKAMLAQGGTVSLYPSKNALVVRSTAANLGEIGSVIEEIDIPRDQVFIEAKFLELSDDAIKDLGINWQVLQGYQVSAGNLAWDISQRREWTDRRTDTEAASDARSRDDVVDERYDIYGDQYQEETLEFLESPPESGNFISQSRVTPTRTLTDTIGGGREAAVDISESFEKTLTDIRTAVIGAADFQLVLSALKQMSGVSVVSNPKIIVANEEPATIHIGQTERPFISTVTPGSDGIAPLVTYNPGDPVDIGVKLQVTPTVNTESNITVQIEPELTRFLTDAIAPNGQTYPVIGKKTIRTVFTLESGKTVAIGGLTETEDRDVTSKIPLLGDIPILGKYLFSHSHKEKRQSETIIFVTVGLAMPQTIIRETGLPEDTELTHRHLITSEVRRRAFREELQALVEDATAERARESSEERSRLLRRDR